MNGKSFYYSGIDDSTLRFKQVIVDLEEMLLTIFRRSKCIIQVSISNTG